MGFWDESAKRHIAESNETHVCTSMKEDLDKLVDRDRMVESETHDRSLRRGLCVLKSISTSIPI